MKKVLLSVAAIFAAMSLNAQEICVFNADNSLGLDSENGTALTAGTVIGETKSIVATIGADDTYKPQDIKATINGQEIAGGLQGGTNPKDADGAFPSKSLVQPAGGAFLQFEAKADGFLYVIHKASSNKAYTVFEEGSAVGYTFAAYGNMEPLPEVYSFTIAGGGEYNYLSETERTNIEFAEQEWTKVNNASFYEGNWTEEEKDGVVTKKWTEIKASGVGVIKFAVAKDCKYIVNANGSKIMAAGFAFSTEDNILVQSDELVIYKGEGAAEPVKKVYSVIGTLVGNWDVDTDMELVNGLYTATIDNVAAGSYKWKIRQDHAWTINWGDAEDGTNIGVQDGKDYVAEMPEGGSITITFNPATAEINAYVVGGAIEPAGPVVIAEIDWTKEAAYYEGVWYSSDYAAVSVDGGLVIDCSQPSPETANYWEPQVPMIAHIPELSEGGQYQVKFTVNAPAAGEIRLDFCSWTEGAKTTQDWVGTVEAGDNELTVDFLDYPGETTDAMIFYQCGKIPGKHVIKNVQVIDLEGADAIKSVKAAKEDCAIYNLAGQKVSASYKGVVIKNGKKYIQ